MEFALWILFGALAGWLTSMIMQTDPEQSTLADISIGVMGALVGGFIMNLLGAPGNTGFNLYSLAVAMLGSIILLAVVRAFRT
jgi:uncharacterized membrane protein YeaQ/YmgE (transglycosylase-associated protein family)